jgi:ubiquinone/menaquinone biosynthesis C-methylase UbiE
MIPDGSVEPAMRKKEFGAEHVQNYQDNYSDLYRLEIDDKSRRMKALKTLAVLKDVLGADLTGLNVLEIGCFTGEIGHTIAGHFRSWCGIDIDPKAIQLAKERDSTSISGNAEYKVMNAESLEIRDDSLDVVICSHVYEHVPHPHRMMAEIRRVLRKDGVCYFAAGNRLVVMEPHHRLPFLTYLPKPLAHVYLKRLRAKPVYYETHFSVFALRRLVKPFHLIDYTEKVIREPVKFFATDMVMDGSLKQKLALLFIRIFYWLSPTYIWVLKNHA